MTIIYRRLMLEVGKEKLFTVSSPSIEGIGIEAFS